MHTGIWVCIPPASFGWSEDNKNNLDRKFGFNLHIWKVVITCLLGTQARLSGPLNMLNKLAFPSLLDQIVHSKLMPRLMSSVPTLLIWKRLGSTGQGLYIATLRGKRDWHRSDLATTGDWENTYPQGLDLNPVSPRGIWGKAFSPLETDLIFSDKSCNTGLLKVNETQPIINALSKFHLGVMPWKEELTLLSSKSNVRSPIWIWSLALSLISTFLFNSTFSGGFSDLTLVLENTQGYGKPVIKITDHTDDRKQGLRGILSRSGEWVGGSNCFPFQMLSQICVHFLVF